MTRIALLLMLLLSTTLTAQQQSPVKKIVGFSHPESVILDSLRNVLYVSNMAGKEKADGFISRVSAEGKILDTVWIGGLEDPKGLLLMDEILHVTDVDKLIKMDPQKGEVLVEIFVPGAKSLNDITADRAGNLYISDLMGNKIFKLDSLGKISEWIKNSDLNRPNGLFKVDDATMLVASWGKDQPGKLLRVGDEGEISEITTGIGNLDGIQKWHASTFLVSDWATGDIYSIDLNGNKEVLIKSEKSSGDFLFLKDTEEVVLPMNHQNSLWWYSLNQN